MANVLKSLKEKFPDLYLLLKNQNDLRFFAPNKLLYAKDSLNDKSFYYNHIFKKSEFDSDLLTNFNGKVLKKIKNNTYKTYLGWTYDKTITIIEELMNSDGINFSQTDSVCTDENQEVVKYSDKQSIPLKKCETAKEYINYYSQYQNEEYNDFKRGIESIKSFLFYILNNCTLLKGYEENFAEILKGHIKKFISGFEIIFKDKSSIACELVDSYIFSQIYDKIMEKFDNFYSEEQKELKNKVIENISKYDISQFMIEKTIISLNINFDEAFDKIKKLKKYKTFFEKEKCLNKINESLINEVTTKYEKVTDEKLDIQGDILINCWTLFISNFIKKYEIKFIYRDYLFLKFFEIGEAKDKNGYITTNFIIAIETLKKELLIQNDRPKVELIKVNSLK
jgi:hypothetical protein